MTPIQFENWVLQRLQASGYRAQRTAQSRDGGADGIAVHSLTGELVIVQCKHRPGRNCDSEPIDDLLKARHAYGQADARLIAVTTAECYTAQARERAARYGVELVARELLLAFPLGNGAA
jgi:HJR/Mrr/RecB family endonuclease